MAVFFLVLFFSYYWHGLGVTVGYHRLLSHRSYRCPKFVEYFWILGGYLALEGSPAWWAAVHRAHHKNADGEKDPHSPTAGKAHAYFTWMFHQDPEVIDVQANCPDILRDPVYRFLEKGDDPLLLVINILFRVFLYYVFGWQVALASLIAGLMILNVPLMLNLFCHIPKLGYRNFTTDNDAVNVWWMAIVAGGEGWHNNHHAFPSSARVGMARHELDLTWSIIKIMRVLGLASHVYEPSRKAILTSPHKLSPTSALAKEQQVRKIRNRMLIQTRKTLKRSPSFISFL